MQSDNSTVHPSVNCVASLGCGGKYRGNIDRDLRRNVRCLFGVDLELEYIKVRVARPQGPGLMTIDHPVLPPHALASAIFAQGGHILKNVLLGPRGENAPAEFWANHCGDSWWEGHPLRAQPDKHATAIPVRVHGDGAKFTRDEKLLILSWTGATAKGGSWMTRMLFTVMPVVMISKPATLKDLGDAFSWYLWQMFMANGPLRR
jgi:hypothetical protein